MASTIKVDNVQNQPGTNIVNKCGTTVTVGAASDAIRSAGNNLQASDGGNLISQCGTTVTLGASGDTIALASGASQTGFGRTGTVDWQTTVKTATFTPTNGEGYFCDTTAGSFAVTLPAGSAGDIVSFSDYARTFDTYALSIAPNGAEKIGGVAGTVSLSTEGQSVTLIYQDSTQGWINIQDSTSALQGQTFVTATGGTPACGVTSGDYKIHVFTGPGTFCVSQLSCAPANNVFNYVVVAGGGGSNNWAGGGAGGYRISADSSTLPAAASPYPITVGGGGAGGGNNNGNPSTFDSITSAGGGYGGAFGSPGKPGGAGGSGGGGGAQITPSPGAGGAGNSPSESPPQGEPGGAGSTDQASFTNGGGGGGAGAAGGGGGGSCTGPRHGGVGRDDHTPEFGSWPQPFYFAGAAYPNPAFYAGGGGGASENPTSVPSKSGGNGGGGPSCASTPAPGTSRSGVDNTGGGGGTSGTGGSGIVLIRYKFQ